MEHEITSFARHLISINPILAYVFFFLNSALQVLFPPYPGDSIIVLSGYLSSVGILNAYLVISITFLSTFLSSSLLYTLSFRFREKILSNKFIIRFFNIDKIFKLENWFKKYGSLAIITNKFLPGVGSMTLISAGVLKLPPISAYISIAFASILHNLLLFMSGKITGSNMDLIKFIVTKYNKFFISILIVAIPLYIYFKYINKLKRKYK